MLAGCAGMAATVVGLFLPWLRSGDALRNSFKTVGVLERVVGLDGIAQIGANVWPVLPMYCAAVIALAALRLATAAAIAGLLPVLVCLPIAIRALTIPARLSISVVSLGPIVTLVGSAFGLMAFAGMLFVRAAPADRR
jgi:hypothetical protein